MTLPDLERALSWAADEGWNPGLDDAAAFYEADPSGFLMGWLDGTPIAAISAVRHADDFGFLGLYICRPEYRGQGYGWKIWQAAMQLFGTRTVGLDGVVEQQANYAKSGFALSHNTQRYGGVIAGGPMADFSTPSPKAAALDTQISGLARPAYMGAWLADTKTRQSLENAAGTALGSIRQCREGYKIGPLYAPDAATAEALVRALVTKAGAVGAAVSIDAPSHNAAANAMCRAMALAPVFATARMYKGAKPMPAHSAEFGICTMELG